MMPDDSNGESSFEFVDRKMEGQSAVDKSVKPDSSVPATAAAAGTLFLPSVAPPSALPSFIAPAPPITLPSVPSSAASAFYPKSFSPVIPASTGSDASLSTPDSSHDTDPGVSSQLIGWVRGAVGGSAGILSRAAEKARSSVHSMITTLDPQMKEFLYSGGLVDVVVASNQEVKVSAVREAFQSVFGKATVSGLSVDTSKVAATQPVGFAAGVKAAAEKLAALRAMHNLPPQQTVLAIENFLLEVGDNKWFDVGVLLLNDPGRGITLETFTQLTPVPAAVVALAQEDTPAEFPLRWSGLAVRVGSIMANNLQVPSSEWHYALTNVSQREIILLAAKVLAGLYKSSVGPIL